MTSSLKYTAVPVLMLVLTGCHMWGRKPDLDPAVPVPDPPRPVVTAPAPKVETPGPPPKIDTNTPEVPSAVTSIPKPPPPKPARKKPPKRQPATAVPGTAPQIGPTVTPVEPAATPAPKLGEILSDEQKSQALRTCDESLGRAREALDQLKAVNLSADQKQSVVRIQTFMKQAEQARERDPQTARQLAERADLLSRDLVRTTK